jgi:gliding motility-associated-like protein
MANANNYQWRIDDVIFLTGKNDFFLDSVNDEILDNLGRKTKPHARFWVIGLDKFGCSDSASFEVRIKQLPNLIGYTDPPVACPNQSVVLHGLGAEKYNWLKYDPDKFKWDTVGITQLLTLKNLSYSDSGLYILEGIGKNGCARYETVNLKLGLKDIVTPNDTAICEGVDVLFTSSGGVEFSWKSPINDTIYSHNYWIRSIQVKDSGNYSVFVKDENQCFGRFDFSLKVNPKPIITFQPDSIYRFCEGSNIELNVNTNAKEMDWVGPNLNIVKTNKNFLKINNLGINDAGEYKVIAYSTLGCLDSTSQFVDVFPTPKFEMELSSRCDGIVSQDSFWLKAISLNEHFYDWYVNNQFVGSNSNIYSVFENPGKHKIKLNARSEEGCESSLEREFEVKNATKLFLPNAFTPNNDHLNNYFKPIATESIFSYQMMIFNRWGEKVFEWTGANSKAPEVGSWDGKIKGELAPVGVYMVIVNYNTDCSLDKNIYDTQAKTTLTLLR